MKISGASWERALDDVRVNPDKVLDDCLGLGTTPSARRFAAYNLGLSPGYKLKKEHRLYCLRIVCCPVNEVDRIQAELGIHDFAPGRMDELVTSDPVAAGFAPDTV